VMKVMSGPHQFSPLWKHSGVVGGQRHYPTRWTACVVFNRCFPPIAALSS
jgi:hypothetical protein